MLIEQLPCMSTCGQCDRCHTSPDDQPQPTAVAVLPYIQGLSDIGFCNLKDLAIKTVFRPGGSLKHILSHPKDPLCC